MAAYRLGISPIEVPPPASTPQCAHLNAQAGPLASQKKFHLLVASSEGVVDVPLRNSSDKKNSSRAPKTRIWFWASKNLRASVYTFPSAANQASFRNGWSVS